MRISLSFVVCCLWCVLGCAERQDALHASNGSLPKPSDGPTIEVRRGAVVSVSIDASRVGRDVMMRGGNAVDAAVATAFALAVTWPEAGNIGGGGFMVIYKPGAEPVVVDYRETAPAAGKSDTFASKKPSEYQLVGVPGTVRGLALAHEKFGKLPWNDLVMP